MRSPDTRIGIKMAAIIGSASMAVAGCGAVIDNGPNRYDSDVQNARSNDRYSVVLSRDGHLANCFSNQEPQIKPAGSRLEVIIFPQVTCVEGTTYFLPSTDRDALGIPANPIQGTLDITVDSAVLADRGQNLTSSPSI